jgi:CTP synthase (UTP-ammonia lyase)
MISIALIGDRDDQVVAHRAIPQALTIANSSCGLVVGHEWIDTARLQAPVETLLSPFAAVWCVPASPYENMDGALAAIRYARETGRPFLGTCGGFQHALIEYFRHVLGQAGADNLESNAGADLPVIAPLACSLVEQRGDIRLAEGSAIAAIYGGPSCHEGYHCSYGFNETYRDLVDTSDVVFSGIDDEGSPRAFELPGHPFYFGTLFQPERSAMAGEPHPLISAFVAAASSFKVPSP